MLAEEHIMLMQAGSPRKLMKRNNGIGAALVVTAAAVLLVSAASYCGGLFMEQNEHFSRLLQSASKYDRTTDTELPAYLDNVANVWDTISEGEQPFFWYIAKTGGLTWQKICAECIDLVSASSRGIAAGSVKALDVYRGPDDGLYLNVNPGSTEGIDRSAELGLVSSGLADVYFSQFLVYSSKLFSEKHQARLFVMMRHPTKRIIDDFYYRQRATWVGTEQYDANAGSMSLAEYAVSDKLVENFMVRSLCDLHDTVDVSSHHVKLAKEILRQKFVVGITDWLDLSIVRFEKYFGWWDTRQVYANQEINTCHFEKIRDGDHVGVHPRWTIGDDPYRKITVRNWADVELFVYAKHLFIEQAALVHEEAAVVD